MGYILLNLAPADWIGIGALAATILGGLAYLIFQMGGLVAVVNYMKPLVAEIPAMKVKVDEMWVLVAEIPAMKVKVEEMWVTRNGQRNSPIVLNETGIQVLKDSGIGQFVDSRYEEILDSVRITGPQNSFQIQSNLIKVITSYKDRENHTSNLEEAAFRSGCSVESVLYVGAIYVRDRIIHDLGF